ncbi:MAG: 50S ribosomal protein L32 [Planctomycetes bacterium]|nr:50S ribosomal protein L32 [Planctomycetota bacterium]
MAQPKRKLTGSRRGMRRSQTALRPPGMALCPRCKNVKRPHAICPVCGTYAGKQVVEVEES